MTPRGLFRCLLAVGAVVVMSTTNWLDPNWRFEVSNALMVWLVIGILSASAALCWWWVKNFASVSLLASVLTGGILGCALGGLAWAVIPRVSGPSADSQLAAANARIAELVQALPGVRLTPEQRAQLVETLKGLGRHKLTVIYLDSPTSGATKISMPIIDSFRDAGWHVDVYPKVLGEGYDNAMELAMHVETPAHISPLQKAVLAALERADIRCGLGSGADVNPDEVVLVAGNLRR